MDFQLSSTMASEIRNEMGGNHNGLQIEDILDSTPSFCKYNVAWLSVWILSDTSILVKPS